MKDSAVVIRPGQEADLERVMDLIRELAEYERAPSEVLIDADMLRRDGFGMRPLYSLIVAEFEGVVVGMALCFVRYSTWKGPVLYLEDIVVNEAFRGKGIGDLLFRSVMQESIDKGFHSLVWQVLDWNEPALRFYHRYGAEFSSEWLNGRLLKNQIEQILNA